jgi:GNAT superfamily N-acetyltransferase
MISIREANKNDINLIIQFIKELAEFEKLTDAVVFDEETVYNNLFGPKPYAYCQIAECDDFPVGFVIYFFNFSTFEGKPGLYIEDLYVRESHRGLGIGFELFRKCVEIATEKNCGRMEWSVLDWNPARKFYEKLGAVGMTEWILHRLHSSKFESIVRKQ